MRTITEEFNRVFEQAGVKHTETQPSNVDPFIDKSKKLAGLLYDDRIDTIASALLGDDFNYMNSDGKIFVADTLWHRDALIQDQYTFIKIVFYLEPVDHNSGALRVIPGSHKLQDQYSKALGSGTFMNDVRSSAGLQWGMEGHEVPAYSITSEPGDMLIFSHTLLHSSWGGGKRRSMFGISLCERFRDEDRHYMKQYMSFSPSEYGEILVSSADQRGMKHLEQGLAYFQSTQV